MDNDSKMLKLLGLTLIDMQLRYRAAPAAERHELKPKLKEAFEQYALYQVALLREGIITTQEDLDEMDQIGDEINDAASKQALVFAVGRFVVFVASKVI